MDGDIVIQRSGGFEFPSDGHIKGYTQTARALTEVFSRTQMPGAWHRVWNALMGAQSPSTGHVEITQAQVASSFDIARAHLAEALAFFQDMHWMRRITGGVYQLNPSLVFNGGASAHSRSQAEWLEATCPGHPTLPNSDDVAAWRTARHRGQHAEDTIETIQPSDDTSA